MLVVKKDDILLAGIFLQMNAVLTFLSSYYNSIGYPLYYIGGGYYRIIRNKVSPEDY